MNSPLADWAEYVDPSCPLNPDNPLNRGLLDDWTIVPNSGWSGGVTLRNLVRGERSPKDGTKNSATTWGRSAGRRGGFGSLVMTANTNDGVDTGSRAGPSGGFTFAAWVRPATVSITQSVATQFQASGNCYFQMYMVTGGVIGTRILQSDSIWIGRSASGVMTAGAWQHVAMTWDGTASASGVRSYRNGVRIDTTNDNGGSFTAPGSGSVAFRLGYQGSAGKEPFSGRMDGAMAYSRALSAVQIGALYIETGKGNPERYRWITVPRKTWFLADVPARVDAPYGVTQPTVPRDQVDPAQPMDAGYPLNACRLLWLYGPKNSGWAGGTTFRDLTRGSRNPHDGSLVNAPAWQDSRYGRAVKMTAASSHYVDLTAFDPYIVGATKVVASAWFNRTAATYSSFFRGTNSTNGFGLIWFNDNILYAIADRGSGIGSGFVYTTANTSTGWQHVQIAYDGSQSTNTTKMRIWLNGVPLSLSSVGTVATSVVSGGTVWRLGQFDSSGVKYQTGATADHSVWIGRLWTDADARNLYEQSRQGYPDAINWLGRSSWTQTPGALSPITGDAALTQGIFALSATGTVAVAGASALTQAAQTLAAAGAVSVAGAAAITQAADTAAAAGAVAVAGATSQTQGADTLASTGAVAIAGAAAVTQGADTLTSAGTLTITGGAALTQAGDTTAGAGVVSIVGGAGIIEAGQTLASAGAVAIAGSAALTQAGQTLYSTGTAPAISAGDVPGGIARRTAGLSRLARRAFAGRIARRAAGLIRTVRGNIVPILQTTLPKDASETVVYIADFSDFDEAKAGETLGTPVVDAVSGLTIGSPTVIDEDTNFVPDGYGIKVAISGGTAGTTYNVEFRGTFSGGSIRVVKLRLEVE